MTYNVFGGTLSLTQSPPTYPPPPALQFDDQFAFRPTGSTTVAVVHLFHSVINLLETEPYVTVISLDFPKLLILYGTRHYSINWLNFVFPFKFTTGWCMDFFDNHSHCTVFREELSSLLHITAVLSVH